MTLQPAAGGPATIRCCTCARAMRETARLSVFEKESEDCLYVWTERNFACGVTKMQGRGPSSRADPAPLICADVGLESLECICAK